MDSCRRSWSVLPLIHNMLIHKLLPRVIALLTCHLLSEQHKSVRAGRQTDRPSNRPLQRLLVLLFHLNDCARILIQLRKVRAECSDKEGLARWARCLYYRFVCLLGIPRLLLPLNLTGIESDVTAIKRDQLNRLILWLLLLYSSTGRQESAIPF